MSCAVKCTWRSVLTGSQNAIGRAQNESAKCTSTPRHAHRSAGMRAMSTAMDAYMILHSEWSLRRVSYAVGMINRYRCLYQLCRQRSCPRPTHEVPHWSRSEPKDVCRVTKGCFVDVGVGTRVTPKADSRARTRQSADN
jgi:hypothetical protein